MKSRKRILLVDDDTMIHQLLRVVLEPQGHEIDSAYDGIDGWRRVETTPYDLVVTDVRMPGLDGLELLRRIRQGHPEVKVMVMTGDSTPGRVLTAIQEQAYTYFSKPFAPTAVADVIAEALRAPSWQDDIKVISARADWITLLVRCKVEVAERLLQFLRELKMDVVEEQRENIATAFHELLLNAIEHGGRSDPQQQVRVSYLRTSRAILYHIQDPGEGFSIEQLPHAALSNASGDPLQHLARREEAGQRPGGFGILLARQLVDELIYNEKGNEVLLIKYLDPPTAGDEKGGAKT